MEALLNALPLDSLIEAIALGLAGALGWLVAKTKTSKDDAVLQKTAEKIVSKKGKK